VARFGDAAARLGDHDDLFDGLGIDSLAALDLLSRVEEAFGIEVPDYEMKGVTTLAALAEVVARRAR
jgi:acyl carrier protein